jgi:hypothetical protein
MLIIVKGLTSIPHTENGKSGENDTWISETKLTTCHCGLRLFLSYNDDINNWKKKTLLIGKSITKIKI